MGKPAPTLYRTYADGSISGNRAHHSGAWPTHAPIGTWIAKLSSRTLLPRTRRQPRPAGDRKSVVSGKSVSVRVDLGGLRLLKKKKRNQRHANTKIKEQH